MTPECFSEKKSIPRAKPRAVCLDRTVRSPHAQPALQTGHLQCRLKTPREKLAPLKIAACIRRAQEASAHNTDAEMMEDERGDAHFVLAALDWCPRQACEPLDMLASMNTPLCIWHGRHARLMCSQAAAR